MQCYKCGFQNDDDSDFCQSCGVRQTVSAQQQAVSIPQPPVLQGRVSCNKCPNWLNGKCAVVEKIVCLDERYIRTTIAFGLIPTSSAIDISKYKFSLTNAVGESVFPNLSVNETIQIYLTSKSKISKIPGIRKSTYFASEPLRRKKNRERVYRELGNDSPDTTIFGDKEQIVSYVNDMKNVCENRGRNL